MPRASVSGQVNVRLGLADMERLEALARSNGISVAAMAKELVLKAMSGEPTQSPAVSPWDEKTRFERVVAEFLKSGEVQELIRKHLESLTALERRKG